MGLIYDVNDNHQNSFGLPTIFVDEYEELEALDSNSTAGPNDSTNASPNGNNLTAIQPIHPENNVTQ